MICKGRFTDLWEWAGRPGVTSHAVLAKLPQVAWCTDMGLTAGWRFPPVATDRGSGYPLIMSSAARHKFDRLFAEGRRALLTGTYKVESAPVEGRARWGIGVVMRPDPVAAHAIEQVAVEAAGVVGGKHWLVGAARSSHLTLRRGLEPYRSLVPLGDPRVARYAAAMRTAVGGVRSLRFAVAGLTLTPVSVMACAAPADAAPDNLAQDLTAALRAEGCGHTGRPPDVWYFNLVYFTGPVRDPHGLVEWVAARRETKLTDVLVEDIQLVRWRHIGDGMTPVVLASAMGAA
jgi:hypothetical protein